MTAGGRQSGGRAGARLLTLCALLAGLFLMHGSPTSAAGCHEPAATAAPAATTAPGASAGAHGHHDGPAAAPALAGPGSARDAGRPAASCVSNRDRDGAALPAPGPAAATPAAVLPAAPAGPHRRSADGPRAPPQAGRQLLLLVCVART
ncbi:hypothetical protein OH807_20700 [Kitasatospora sp. NBC_01560]|uniref:hypothetical protein n=1 Tax=Kitasatospora sp. NBC_01560 TaxID=2975965 RepID=UPI00386F700C